MQSGKLKHRLTLQKYSYTRDAAGDVIPVWTDLAQVYAKVEGVQGREFLAANAQQHATTWRIIMRYRNDFDMSDRLVAGGVAYNIKAILPNNDRTQLVLMCESGLLEV